MPAYPAQIRAQNHPQAPEPAPASRILPQIPPRIASQIQIDGVFPDLGQLWAADWGADLGDGRGDERGDVWGEGQTFGPEGAMRHHPGPTIRPMPKTAALGHPAASMPAAFSANMPGFPLHHPRLADSRIAMPRHHAAFAPLVPQHLLTPPRGRQQAPARLTLRNALAGVFGALRAGLSTQSGLLGRKRRTAVLHMRPQGQIWQPGQFPQPEDPLMQGYPLPPRHKPTEAPLRATARPLPATSRPSAPMVELLGLLSLILIAALFNL